MKQEKQALLDLRELYGKFGYTQYKMSKFEEYDLYVRNKSFLEIGRASCRERGY